MGTILPQMVTGASTQTHVDPEGPKGRKALQLPHVHAYTNWAHGKGSEPMHPTQSPVDKVVAVNPFLHT